MEGSSKDKNLVLPPWVSYQRLGICDHVALIVYKMIALFPALVTFGLYFYLYAFFFFVNMFFNSLQIHVVPNLSGDYTTLLGVANPWNNSVERKTAVYRTYSEIIIFNFEGLMLLISIIQTIRTSPGQIPDEKEWDMHSENNDDSHSDEEKMHKALTNE